MAPRRPLPERRPEETLGSLRQAVSLDPRGPQPWLRQSEILEEQERWEDAFELGSHDRTRRIAGFREQLEIGKGLGDERSRAANATGVSAGSVSL